MYVRTASVVYEWKWLLYSENIEFRVFWINKSKCWWRNESELNPISFNAMYSNDCSYFIVYCWLFFYCFVFVSGSGVNKFEIVFLNWQFFFPKLTQIFYLKCQFRNYYGLCLRWQLIWFNIVFITDKQRI